MNDAEWQNNIQPYLNGLSVFANEVQRHVRQLENWRSTAHSSYVSQAVERIEFEVKRMQECCDALKRNNP